MGPATRQAALAGAAYAGVSAATYIAGVAAACVFEGNHWTLAIPRFVLDPRSFDVPVPVTVMAAVASASLLGALVGRVGPRVVGSPLRRTFVIFLVAIPALYLSVATALLLLYASQAVKAGLSALAVLPLACLLYAMIGTIFMLPTAALPMLFSALLLEGATRPAELGLGGLAVPAARRFALQVLVAVAVAFGTFAWFR